MNKLIYIALCIIVFASCTNNKDYKYVEVVNEPDLYGGSTVKEKDPVVISAPSDSAAYLKAVEHFCVSNQVYQYRLNEGMGTHLSTPIRFKLYNPSGEDISLSVTFANKEEKEKEIVSNILGSASSIKGSEVTNPEAIAKIDSTRVKELLPYFEVKKDEFDPNGKVWYS